MSSGASTLRLNGSEQLPNLCDHVRAQAAQLVTNLSRKAIQVHCRLGTPRRYLSKAISVGNRVAVPVFAVIFRETGLFFDSPWGYCNGRIFRKRGGYGCFIFRLPPFCGYSAAIRRECLFSSKSDVSRAVHGN